MKNRGKWEQASLHLSTAVFRASTSDESRTRVHRVLLNPGMWPLYKGYKPTNPVRKKSVMAIQQDERYNVNPRKKTIPTSSKLTIPETSLRDFLAKLWALNWTDHGTCQPGKLAFTLHTLLWVFVRRYSATAACRIILGAFKLSFDLWQICLKHLLILS